MERRLEEAFEIVRTRPHERVAAASAFSDNWSWNAFSRPSPRTGAALEVCRCDVVENQASFDWGWDGRSIDMNA
jgi:hypothetical protein